MTQIKKLIAQIFSKKSMKVWSVFLILGIVFVAQTYAQTTQTWETETVVNTLSYYIHILLSILSWLWIILANLAGKLMTNDILYWWFLHLDASLWTLWNIMKNFANFALWFFVLFAIVKNIISWPFGRDAGERSPIKTIKKTLIAGVLIQSSWFLMWAVVDISTIMTSAIWAFPSQFIAANQDFQWNMHNSIKSLSKSKKIKFNPSSTGHMVVFDTDENNNLDDDDIKKLLDTITPSYDSVSGPLIFLWFSVFNFNEFENFGSVGSPTTWIDKWWDLFLSLWLSALILVFFTLMMFFIFLFNLFRLIMLWIIIPLLPVIMLLNVFKITDKLGGWKGMDLSKFMSPKTIFMLVFKPVIMVWALSLILVILILMKNIIAWNKESKIILEDQWNMVIESRKDDSGYYTSTMKSDGIFEFSMTGVKDTFADIIVYLFGLFLIFFLVKMVVSTKTGISFIDDSLDNTFKSFQSILTNLPVIPIAGWIGVNALQDAFSANNVSGMATRIAWVDLARQYELLGMNQTFSWLTTTMNRDNWISTAVAAGKNIGYRSYTDMTKSKDFNDKLSERNRVNNKNQISQKDIDDAFAVGSIVPSTAPSSNSSKQSNVNDPASDWWTQTSQTNNPK